MNAVEETESIAGQMAASLRNPEIQANQTRFRMRLVEEWRIPAGSKVLEIGCGQGDMTAALAHAVGSGGHVMAVDRGSPEDGGPVTLGESAEHLMETPLGRRIDFCFRFDVLDPAHNFPSDAFDLIVLAHCSWYFESLDQLRRTLLRVRPWAKRLCFSEWDMEPQAMDQVAHLLSVLIQGQIEAYKVESRSNVRTPFSRATLQRILRETGWSLTREATLDASQMQDAEWEIDHCLKTCEAEAEALDLPLKVREFLASQIDTLQSVAGKGENRSLPSYTMVADRSPNADSGL